MKKMFLLAVAALGLSMGAANAADKSFDGFYLGGSGSYAKTEVLGAEDKAFGGVVLGGYGKQFGKWYIGGELSAGYSGAKVSEGDESAERGFSYGAAVRGGYEVMDGVLGYGLVGVENTSTDLKVGGDEVSLDDYAFRYGVGVEAFVTDNMTIRSEVSMVNYQGKGALPKDDEVRATVGIGYHF